LSVPLVIAGAGVMTPGRLAATEKPTAAWVLDPGIRDGTVTLGKAVPALSRPPSRPDLRDTHTHKECHK